MTRSSVLVWVGVILISLPGCAGGVASPSRNRSLIDREELTGAIASLSAYDAIQRLRPGWLAPRGASSVMSSSRFPSVLMNNTVRDDIDVLHTLPVDDVESIRYLDARDATTRFGTGYVNGLIEILPRTGQR